MKTPVERPADSAGELYSKTATTPEEAFRAIGRLRKEARDEIDRLIRFLDETDDHMEFEDDSADCEDGADGEPSLGLLDSQIDQARIAVGDSDYWNVDRELDDSDDEPSIGYDENRDVAELDTADDEPSLGWTIDGYVGGGHGCDLEAAAATAEPQGRTDIPCARKVRVEAAHRKILRGVSAPLARRLNERLDRAQRHCGWGRYDAHRYGAGSVIIS